MKRWALALLLFVMIAAGSPQPKPKPDCVPSLDAHIQVMQAQYCGLLIGLIITGEQGNHKAASKVTRESYQRDGCAKIAAITGITPDNVGKPPE